MDPFFACCLFDARWVFCRWTQWHQWVLLVPLAVDVVTVGAILVERVITSAVNDVSLVVMLGLLIILAAIHGYFALQVHHTVARKMENIDSNIDIIKQFLLHSDVGLLLLICSISQLILNAQYIGSTAWPHLSTNYVRYWIDIASWCYLCFVILLFLLSKLLYLLFAWKNPKIYLRHKGII